MKTIIRSLTTAALALAAMFVTGSALALTEAKVITASDLKNATWNNGVADIGGWTVTLNGNTLNDDGTISISQSATAGVTIHFPAAVSQYTVLMKYSDYIKATSNYTALMDFKNSNSAYVGMLDDGKARAFYVGMVYTSFGNVIGTGSSTTPVPPAAGTMGISYKTGGSGLGSFLFSADGTFQNSVYKSGITWSGSTISDITLGGLIAGQLHDKINKPASLTISDIAIFTDYAITADDANALAAYEFPEPSVARQEWNGVVPTTAQEIFPQLTLAELKRCVIEGWMGGSGIDSDATTRQCGAVVAVDDSSSDKLVLQFQLHDGEYLKYVNVEFTETNDAICAKKLGTGYVTFSEDKLGTVQNLGSGGYEVKRLVVGTPGVLMPYCFHLDNDTYNSSYGTAVATKQGDDTVAWTTGKFDKGAFSQNNQDYSYVVADANGLTSAKDGWAISLWVKPNGMATWKDVFGFEIGDDHQIKLERMGNDRFALYGDHSLEPAVDYSSIGNNWMHLAFVYTSNGNLAIYLNGTKVSTLANTVANGNLTKLYIGTNGLNDGRATTPLIDEVAIYDGALDDARIKWLANNAPSALPLLPQEIAISGNSVSISDINGLVEEGAEIANVTLDANATISFDVPAVAEYNFICNGALTFDGFPGQQEATKFNFSGITGGYKQAAKVIGINLNAGQGRQGAGNEANKLADNADATVPGFTIYGRGLTQIVANNTTTVTTGIKLYDTAADTTTEIEGASISYTCANTYNVSNGAAQKCANLIEGYLDDGQQVKITVSGIPFGAYDVIVFASTDSADRKFSPTMVNGVLYTSDSSGNARQASGPADTWGQSKVTTITMGTNAMRINNLVGDLSVVGGKNANNARGGIAAVLIIERKLRIGDEYVFANGDNTASFDGYGNYRLDGLTLFSAGGINRNVNVAVKDVTVALNASGSAKPDYVTLADVRSGAPVMGGAWTRQDMGSGNATVTYKFADPVDIVLDTKNTFTDPSTTRLQLYHAETDIRGCIGAGASGYRPAFAVTTVITSLPPDHSTAIVNTDEQQTWTWGTLPWNVMPTKELDAEITVTGSKQLIIFPYDDTDATAKSITFKGSGSVDFTTTGLYDGGKITSEIPLVLGAAMAIDVDVGANDLTFSYTGFAIPPMLNLTCGGNLTLSGGSSSNPLSISKDFNKLTLAEDTYVKYDDKGTARLYDVTGAGATSVFTIARNGNGAPGFTDGSNKFNNVIVGSAATGNQFLWFEHTKPVSDTVGLKLTGNIKISDDTPNPVVVRSLTGNAKLDRNGSLGLSIKNLENADFAGTSTFGLTVLGSEFVQTFSGAYNQSLTIGEGGKVKLTGNANPSSVTMAAGSWLSLDNGRTAASLTLNGNVTIEVASGTATITAISGSGSITKTGAGTLNLPANYAGAITLSNGLINATATSTVTITGDIDLAEIGSANLPLAWTLSATDNDGSLKLPANFPFGQIAKASDVPTGLTFKDSEGSPIAADNFAIVNDYIELKKTEIIIPYDVNGAVVVEGNLTFGTGGSINILNDGASLTVSGALELPAEGQLPINITLKGEYAQGKAFTIVTAQSITKGGAAATIEDFKLGTVTLLEGMAGELQLAENNTKLQFVITSDTITAAAAAVLNNGHLIRRFDANRGVTKDANNKVSAWTELCGTTAARAHTDGPATDQPMLVTGGVRNYLDFGVTGSYKDLMFDEVTTAKTVIEVIDIEQNENAFLLGHHGANNFNFHRGGSGAYGNGSHAKFSKVRDNGDEVANWSGTVIPTGFRVISLKLSQNCSANCFSQDRSEGSRNGGRKLCEVLIFDTELSDSDFAAVEAYLTSKWSLAYKNEATLATGDNRWSTLNWGEKGYAPGSPIEITIGADNARLIYDDVTAPINSIVFVDGGHPYTTAYGADFGAKTIASGETMTIVGSTDPANPLVYAGALTVNGTLKTEGYVKLSNGGSTVGTSGTIEIVNNRTEMYLGDRKMAGTLTIDAGATFYPYGSVDGIKYDGNSPVVNVYGTLDMSDSSHGRWTLRSNITLNFYAGSTCTGNGQDGATQANKGALQFNTTGCTLNFKQKDGQGGTVDFSTRIHAQNAFTMNVEDGVTVNMSGSLGTGKSPFTLTGAGTINLTGTYDFNAPVTIGTGTTLIIDGGSCAGGYTNNGSIEVKNGNFDMGSVRDFEDLGDVTFGEQGTLSATATTAELRVGKANFVNLPTSLETLAFNANGTVVALPVAEGTATYTGDPLIYGLACWYDFTYTNTYTTARGSQNQATMQIDGGVTVSYKDNGDDGVGITAQSRPWMNLAALETLDKFAVVIVAEMPVNNKTTVLTLGNTLKGALHFATGTKEDGATGNNIVEVNYVTDTEVKNITTMTVPNASSARHVYIVEKTATRTFVVYLDGMKWKTINTDYDIELKRGGSGNNMGIQIGSDFGGRLKDGQIYSAASGTGDGCGVFYVLRIYNDLLSAAEIAKYTADYKYTDPNGESSRVFTAVREDWVGGEETTPWTYTKDGEEPVAQQAAEPNATVTVDANGGESIEAIEIAVNLESNTEYTDFNVKGSTPVKFVKGDDTTGAIKATGSVTLGVPTTIEYGALDIVGVPLTLSGDTTVTFDYSKYVVTGKYAAFDEELTGDIEQDDDRVTVIPPDDANWNAVKEYRSGAYGIRFSPKRESATTLYLALNAENTTTINNDTLFTLEDGTKVLRFYADDKVVLTGTGAFSVASGLAVPLNSITVGNGATVKPADQTFTGAIVVDAGGTFDLNHQQENWTGSIVLNGGVLTDSVGGAQASQVQNKAISLTADSEIHADSIDILSIGNEYNEFNFPLNGYALTKTGSANYEIYKPKFTTGGKLIASAGGLTINGFTVDGAALVELEVTSGATLTFADPNSKGFTKNGRLNLKLGEGASFTNDQGIGFDELAGTGTFVATGVTAFSDMIDFKGKIVFDLSGLEPLSELTLITAPTDTDFLLDGITFELAEGCEDDWTLKVSADKVVATSTIKLIEVDGKSYPTMEEAFDVVSNGSVLRILDADRLTFDGQDFTLDGVVVELPAGFSFLTGEGGTIVASLLTGKLPLRISEICPKPDDLDPNGVESSWVELVNDNAYGYIDLGEYELQRFNRGKKVKAGKFANLVSRRLGAGERIVVYMTEGYTDGDDLAFAKGLVAEDEVKEVNGIMIVPAKINPKKYPLVRLLKGKTVVDSVIVPSDLPDGKSVIVGHSTDGATQRWVADPTKGAANPATEGLTAIGPNVGPLYGVDHKLSDNDPVAYAESGADYPVTLDVNPVDAANDSDAITSVTLIYRTDINNDDPTSFGRVTMEKGEEPDEFHGDRWTASIPASALPAAGMLVQWKAEITDAAGNKWISPSFMNKDDGYEWYGTIVRPDEETQLSGSLDTMHLFATTVAKGGTGDRFIVADAPGNGSGNRIMNIDYDALMTESGHADQKAAYPYGARVNIFDSSTMRYYDYVRIDLRGNTSAGFKKKSHGLRFAKANPLKIAAKDGFNGINVSEIRKTSFISEMCDPSRLRQMTSFWLFNNEKSPAPFDYPVRLNLNGEFYQIGFHSERFSDDLIEKSYGLNKFVYSYKNIGTFQPGSGTSAGGIEKKTPDDGNETGPEALKELEAFRQSIRAAGEVAASKDGSIDTGLENAALTKTVVESFDLPSWLNYLAIARITHENDDVWANISGYWDSPWTKDGVRGTGTWHPLVYDTNLSFGQWYFQDDSARGHVGLLANADDFKSHPFYGGCRVRAYKSNGTAAGNSNYAVESIYQHEKFRRLYLRRLRTLMDKYLADESEETNPIAAKMREFLTYMGCDFTTEQDGDDCVKELQVWGHVNPDSASGCGAVNVWTSETEPQTLFAGYKEIWEDYILPRRTHLFETHAAANHTADQIGYANNLCAGIPAEQSELATLIGAEGSPNFTVRYDATIKAVVIKNKNNETVDMSGWTLEGPVAWTLPAGTIIDQAIDGVPGEVYVTADRRFTIGAMGEITDQVVVGNGKVGTGALVLKSGETIVAQEAEPTVDFDDDTDTPVAEGVSVPADWLRENVLELRKVDVTDPAEGPTVNAAIKKLGRNGFRIWESWTLGLEPKVETSKPYLVGVQNDEADKVAFEFGGIEVQTGDKVPTVKYAVEYADALGESATWTPSGDPSTTPSISVGLPTTESGKKVRYYRPKFSFGN